MSALLTMRQLKRLAEAAPPPYWDEFLYNVLFQTVPP
jgi:hypothetical protein